MTALSPIRFTHRVVLHDPHARYPCGAVYAGAAAQALHSKGVATLPVDPDIRARNAVAGFMMGHYGSGWSFDPYRPTRGAPLVIYVAKDLSQLHYAARVVPDRQDRNPIIGKLRLNVDTAQAGVIGSGMVQEEHPLALDKLTERDSPDPDHGWTLYGRCSLTAGHEGYLGLSLYGNARNCRVSWAAVTQTR